MSMANLSDRIKNLTPEQQELLRRRMQVRNSQNASPAADLPKRERSSNTLRSSSEPVKVDFSLFFFSADVNVDQEERYRLLFDSARFADANGFTAIWTPERHFQAFGGLYPNPSVLSAALAMITQRVQLRAGSLVLPLHNPVRVAEDWALVDNLSHGRAAISFATGWHEPDYVIAPQNYENRRELMFQNISVVQRRCSGTSVRGDFHSSAERSRNRARANRWRRKLPRVHVKGYPPAPNLPPRGPGYAVEAPDFRREAARAE